MFLQILHQVSFSTRIPVAFPTGDANSLSKNILMYACTLTEGGNPGHGEQRRTIQRISKSASASGSLGSLALTPSTKCYPGISPAVMMVSKHVDGSLNQVWEQIEFDLTSNRKTVFVCCDEQMYEELTEYCILFFFCSGQWHLLNVLLSPTC